MTQNTEQQPVAYLWQHTMTGQTKALMRDDVFTAGRVIHRERQPNEYAPAKLIELTKRYRQ